LWGIACGAAFLAGIGLVSVAAPADAPNIRGDATGPTTSPSEVIKGGSYLCASNYCARYQASAVSLGKSISARATSDSGRWSMAPVRNSEMRSL
jgi:hypothetical protein